MSGSRRLMTLLDGGEFDPALRWQSLVSSSKPGHERPIRPEAGRLDGRKKDGAQIRSVKWSCSRLTHSGVAVPFLDLSPMHAPLRDELVRGVGALIDSGAFTNGPVVHRSRSPSPRIVGVDHCVGVSSGLDALRLALLQPTRAGRRGDRPGHDFVATWEAVTPGGRPSRVPSTCPPTTTASTSARPRRLSRRGPTAICRYISSGRWRTCDGICGRREATRPQRRRGRCPGSRRASAKGSRGRRRRTRRRVQLLPGQEPRRGGRRGRARHGRRGLAERVRALREHGQTPEVPPRRRSAGRRRIDTIQALVLSHKLPLARRLERANGARSPRGLSRPSKRRRSRAPVRCPSTASPSGTSTSSGRAIRRGSRRSSGRGIATGRHYPEPPHLSAAYASLGYEARARSRPPEALAAECLSLPIFPGIQEAQCGRVADGVTTWFDG